MTTATVLVTGATGFIAKHCIAELLKAGHTVRGTVRNRARAAAVTRAVQHAGADPSRLSFAVADLLRDDGWEASAKGCSHLLHVASPFPLRQPQHRDDIIIPARDGTVRVLAAATRAGIKRVVLTSSIVAIIYPRFDQLGHIYTEADWTDPGRHDVTPYVASKAIAERAAWDYVARTPGAPELTVINPGFVHGPALDSDLSSSHEALRLMGTGSYPALPRAGYPVSDVRDVAAMHAAAMLHPAAAGERFICAEGFLTFKDMARQMVKAIPDLASKVPQFEVPSIAARVASLFDKSLRAVLPDLGHARPTSNAKARQRLGFAFRPAEEAVTSAVLSLRELRLV